MAALLYFLGFTALSTITSAAFPTHMECVATSDGRAICETKSGTAADALNPQVSAPASAQTYSNTNENVGG